MGDHLPRKCGIATFTSDLLAAVAGAHPQSQCLAVSVNDTLGAYEYPEVARFEIEEQDLSPCLRAADFFNISLRWSGIAQQTKPRRPRRTWTLFVPWPLAMVMTAAVVSMRRSQPPLVLHYFLGCLSLFFSSHCPAHFRTMLEPDSYRGRTAHRSAPSACWFGVEDIERNASTGQHGPAPPG